LAVAGAGGIVFGLYAARGMDARRARIKVPRS
jgi:hypothetical protein